MPSPAAGRTALRTFLIGVFGGVVVIFFGSLDGLILFFGLRKNLECEALRQ